MGASKDNRSTPRVKKLIMTAYHPKGDSESRTPLSLGRTVDISPSGVGMEIYKEVEVGAIMEMEIDLEAVPLLVRGKVIRTEPISDGNFLVGIQFDEQQELLNAGITANEIATLCNRVKVLEMALADLVRTALVGDNGAPRSTSAMDEMAYMTALRAARNLLNLQ